MSSKIFVCSFADKTIANGAAKRLDSENIAFSLKEEDGGVSLYCAPSDEERILKIVKVYEEELKKNGGTKSFFKRFADTAIILIIAIVFLTVYVYGIDKIINFLKNLF